MSRTFFPTYSLNRFGVRVTGQRATLGAVERFPAEPTPRAAMTPTRPILGAVVSELNSDGVFRYPLPGPMPIWSGIRIIGPVSSTPAAAPAPAPAPISSSGGGGAAPTPAIPASEVPQPVSAQVLPTPTVATPPAAIAVPLLISSGGGTQTPSTPAVTAPASTGIVDSVASWLGGKTMIFSYDVPNALLAGIVVLGFAWLSSGTKKR